MSLFKSTKSIVGFFASIATIITGVLTFMIWQHDNSHPNPAPIAEPKPSDRRIETQASVFVDACNTSFFVIEIFSTRDEVIVFWRGSPANEIQLSVGDTSYPNSTTNECFIEFSGKMPPSRDERQVAIFYERGL